MQPKLISQMCQMDEMDGRFDKLFVLLFATCLFLFGSIAIGLGAPKSELWSKWLEHEAESQERVDHSGWGDFLAAYLVTGHPLGINRIRYSSVTRQDKAALEAYVDRLEYTSVSSLNRAEQEAYWINLYNALTVKVVLDHYPVKSIKNIDISPGLFASGPWDAKLLTIEGEAVKLNDIEHRILRPIWKDNRIHYALNCASLGCPNLQSQAFSRDNMKRLLEKGAREYINRSGGARINGNRLILSSIYDWFQEDFGRSEEKVIQHLLKYAEGPLAETLRGFTGRIKYGYDWALNEP